MFHSYRWAKFDTTFVPMLLARLYVQYATKSWGGAWECGYVAPVQELLTPCSSIALLVLDMYNHCSAS